MLSACILGVTCSGQSAPNVAACQRIEQGIRCVLSCRYSAQGKPQKSDRTSALAPGLFDERSGAFVLQRKTSYAKPMLRIALRLLIALALILQGGVGATAAFASGTSGHHCHSSMDHDGQAPKCPCCPAKSFGMSCADACMTVAALPSVPATFHLHVDSISPSIDRTPLVAAAIDMPLRPPIA